MATRKPENTFRSGVHKYLPAALHHEKMSNPYSSGTADDWYSAGRDLWIEYKWLARCPKISFNLTAGRKPALSPLQQKWLRGRYEEGRNVAVIVGSPAGSVILRALEWELEVSAYDLVRTQLEIARWIERETKHVTKATRNSGESNKSVL
jgi:hypothetical protein